MTAAFPYSCMTSTLLFRDKLSFGGTARMQTYTTQMDAARKGIITPQMEIVAKKEYRTTCLLYTSRQARTRRRTRLCGCDRP